ncbi:hypothetical protein T310_8924, partial [Rasamsonia emersonii CBS 393.64]
YTHRWFGHDLIEGNQENKKVHRQKRKRMYSTCTSCRYYNCLTYNAEYLPDASSVTAAAINRLISAACTTSIVSSAYTNYWLETYVWSHHHTEVTARRFRHKDLAPR